LDWIDHAVRNLHLSAASPNAMFLESVRGFYEGWYREVDTGNVVIAIHRLLAGSTFRRIQ